MEPEKPVWATVDTSRARVERLRHFGEVYMGLALWRCLKLDAFFDGMMAGARRNRLGDDGVHSDDGTFL